MQGPVDIAEALFERGYPEAPKVRSLEFSHSRDTVGEKSKIYPTVIRNEAQVDEAIKTCSSLEEAQMNWGVAVNLLVRSCQILSGACGRCVVA